MTLNIGPKGYALLRNPRTNKGTAFSDEERRNLGVEGLLPPVPTSLDHQIARIHPQLAMLDNDLQEYLFLSDLQSRNEPLYYAVLMSDPAGFMPPVYTDRWRGLPEDRSYLPCRPRSLRADFGQGPRQAIAFQLAREGRAVHRRHRWRTDSRSWRSRRRRHGYSNRKARPLYRLRRRAPGNLSPDHDRRWNKQCRSA